MPTRRPARLEAVTPAMTNALSDFERDLLESVRQARRGEAARVHTPQERAARERSRDLGAELLEAARQMKRGEAARVTRVAVSEAAGSPARRAAKR